MLGCERRQEKLWKDESISIMIVRFKGMTNNNAM